jgi:hypothetical protein
VKRVKTGRQRANSAEAWCCADASLRETILAGLGKEAVTATGLIALMLSSMRPQGARDI